MLTAVVFDFDGVIVDSEPLHCAAFREALQSQGFDLGYEEYLERYVGLDDRDCLRSVLFDRTGVKLPADAPQLVALVKQKMIAFEAIVERGFETVPGTLELIDQLGAVMPIAIASGAARPDIELICGKLNILDRFAAIVSADDVAQSKPDPQSYRMAVEQLAGRFPQHNILPHHCLAIEDTSDGLASATGAGLMTLGVTTTLPAQRLSRADRVVSSLKGVTLNDLRQWFAHEVRA